MTSHERRPPLVVVCGPTASGKTALALALGQRFDMEVISADSRQVYRGMDIGTAKATVEEQRLLPHHLIDVVDPEEPFTAADFARLGRRAAADILRRGRRPLVVGGTGLYIRALTEGLVSAPGPAPRLRQELHALEAREGSGTLFRRLQKLDPEAAERIHPANLVRIVRALEVRILDGRPLSELQREHAFSDRPFRTLKIGLAPPRETLFRHIDRRVEQMMEKGLLAEAENLLRRGCSPDLKAMQTLGYREALAHLRGELSSAEAVALIQRHTRRYAKRQLTWFRRDPEIIWFETCEEFAKMVKLLEHFYAA